MCTATTSATSNMMAVQPFARTGYGHALMDGIIRQHKLNFDYGLEAQLGPSDEAVQLLREQRLSERGEAKKHTETGNLLYNGHSDYNNTFFSEKRKMQQRNLEATNQLAKMRFTGHVEKSNNQNMAKNAEIEATRQAAVLRQEKEDNWRKSTLFGNTNHNMQMLKDQNEMKIQD